MQRSTISMFAQLVQLMGGKIEFHNLVNKYQSDKGAKGLTMSNDKFRYPTNELTP